MTNFGKFVNIFGFALNTNINIKYGEELYTVDSNCTIATVDGVEVLVRMEPVFDCDGNVYKANSIMTKDEFMLAYNTWVKGNISDV